MWRVLEGGHLSVAGAKCALTLLGEPIPTIFGGGGLTGQEGSRPIDDVFCELEQFPVFESLAAVIIMLALADDIQNIDLWNNFCRFYRHMIPSFIDRGQIPFHEEIFDVVDLFARERVFVHLDDREDRLVSWRDELPRCDEMIAARRAYFESMPKILIG